jgi:PhnB protein
MLTLNPYLIFNNNCEDAFNFYKDVFGGEILFMGRFKDMPSESKQSFPNSPDEKIMHATLQINADTILMGADHADAYDEPSKDKFYLYISLENQEECYRIFDQLSVAGKVTMPLTKTFWSTHYGMVLDQFGIHWKITFDPNKDMK